MFWLTRHLDPDWKCAHLLWSIRVALFWAAFAGAFMALPAFQDMISPFWFAALCMFGSLTVCVARLTKQPGLE